MTAKDPYDRWVESLREADVPSGFADRVMTRVEGGSGFERWWRIPVVRVAAWTAACLVLAVRVASAGAIFLFN